MQRAEALKERGNRHFVAKQYSAACSSYTEGLTALDNSGIDNEEHALLLRSTLLCNRAAASLPPSRPPHAYARAVEDCNEVLAIEPGKGKAHYRRGLAYEGLGQYSAALDDLRQVMVTLPTLVVDEAFDRVETLYQMTPGMPSRENWKEEEEGKEEGKEKEGPFPPFPKERARIVDRAFRNVFSRAVGLTNALSYFVHDKPPPSPPSSPPSSPPPSPPPSPPRPSSSSSSSPPPLPPPPLPTHLVVRPDIKPAAVAAANAGNIDLAQELLLLNPSEGGELQQ